jgi:hypothetical protein
MKTDGDCTALVGATIRWFAAFFISFAVLISSAVALVILK